MKKIIALSLALVITVAFSSCLEYKKAYEGELKDFSVEEMTITLTDEFSQTSTFASGFTAAYGAADTTVIILKETFEQLGIDSTYSAEDYAWSVHDGYSVEYITDVFNEDGIVCFEFTNTAEEGGVYAYFAACYKSSDSFWLLLFATDEPFYDVYRPYFISWAKTVRFS